MSDREKDAEILVLRHQIAVLERQLGGVKVTFSPEDRAFLEALLVPLPREFLHRLRLLVRPDRVLRWHRDLMRRHHARTCRPKRPGRPPTVCSIRLLIYPGKGGPGREPQEAWQRATRYGKRPESYMAGLQLRGSIIWMRSLDPAK